MFSKSFFTKKDKYCHLLTCTYTYRAIKKLKNKKIELKNLKNKSFHKNKRIVKNYGVKGERIACKKTKRHNNIRYIIDLIHIYIKDNITYEAHTKVLSLVEKATEIFILAISGPP